MLVWSCQQGTLSREAAMLYLFALFTVGPLFAIATFLQFNRTH